MQNLHETMARRAEQIEMFYFPGYLVPGKTTTTRLARDQGQR